MEGTQLAQDQAFLAYLDQWITALPARTAAEVFAQPQRAALLSVDLVQGFCTIGPLASPRVDSIVRPAVDLMQLAWDSGVRHLILSQDTHEPDAVEFGAWPPHCVRDTPESQTVEAITALPFYSQAVTIRKNSIATGLDSEMEDWLITHPEVNTFVVVGDCTDLCVYQIAMHLRLDANGRQIERRVIVPENAVQTYDLPVEAAQASGIFPHPGDLVHKVFLYHMALNGIEVVRSIGA